jgi:hypothetical protein
MYGLYSQYNASQEVVNHLLQPDTFAVQQTAASGAVSSPAPTLESRARTAQGALASAFLSTAARRSECCAAGGVERSAGATAATDDITHR